MANHLTLEEAAKRLGIPTDRLVELRSQGQVRGFRSGSSWKFPEDEIDRLKDELGDVLSGGSGLLVSELELGSSLSSTGSKVIGGDSDASSDSGSDLELGSEDLQPGSGGSDVNLVAGDGNGSDVTLVPAKGAKKPSKDPLEFDSSDLKLAEPALGSDVNLDLAIEPNAGSTGPVTDAELSKLTGKKPKADESGLEFDDDDDSSGDMLLVGDDSGELLGGDSDSDMSLRPSGASSLELMSDLGSEGSGMLSRGSRGNDVLSELDLLSAEAGGSGMITGDSAALLATSSGSLNLSGAGSSLAGLDDALDDDDDLMIADDDDDLVVSSAGGDISIAGDSGINLMSPSDSGLSLESEPLDLAGSGLSALDLGAELAEGSGIGSGSGKSSGKMRAGGGSGVDFEADEEFQLSPSGLGLEIDLDSGSQVIEVEDSDAIGEAVEFDEVQSVDVFGGDDLGGGVFGDAEQVVADGAMVEEEGGMGLVESSTASTGRALPMSYEIPFTTLQVIGLAILACTLGVCGMLMTELVRNMWAYEPTSAPVSSLTDAIISWAGWGGAR
jgi:excisionase family DNA binding protein